MGMIGLAAMAVVAVLAALHMPAALALILAGVAGLVIAGAPDAAWQPLTALLTAPDLLLVPLVLMLGNAAFYAGFSTRVHDAAAVILQRRRGGLQLAALLGCAGFAATSGSSVASVTTLSRIALPGMIGAGQDPRLAGASVAMGSTLGALLPPSMMLILWGLLTDTPVATMYLAGLVPAALSLAGMVAVVLWWVWHDPKAAPLPQRLPIAVGAALRAVWPAPILFAVIVGGIASGHLTPTAAVAICLAATLFFAVIQHRLTADTMWQTLRSTVGQSVTVLLFLIGARLFLTMIQITGTPDLLAGWFEGMPPLLLVALLGVGCVILGLLVEPAAMLVLILPVAMAIAALSGHGAVWAGIIAIKLVETAMILPPMGLIVIIMAATGQGVTAQQVFSGIGRFLFADLLVLAALVLFPALTLAVVV